MFEKKTVPGMPDLVYFPSILSGLMLTAGFPSLNVNVLMFAALAPFLVSLEALDPRQAFYAGGIMGLCHYITLIYWIVPTLSTYGGLHPVLSLSALILLSIYLSLFFGLFAFGIKKLDPPPVMLPLAGGCLWAGLEWIRTYALTGFAWGALGYSQYTHLFLIQAADLAGVLGISFLILVSNHAIALCWQVFAPSFAGKRPAKKQVLACLAYGMILFGAVLGYGRHRIQTMDQIMASCPGPTVSVIQGNIRQELKWSQEFKTSTMEKYGALSLEAARSNPDLLVWPETALPFYYGYDMDYTPVMDQIVQRAGTSFLIGSPAFERTRESILFFNRATMLNPLGLEAGHYDKTHLVPFGEYVPFGEILQFLGKLTEQAGDFTPGHTGFVPLTFAAKDNQKFQTGVLICFEILFPSISAKFTRAGADFLTTTTNDAWFGRTSAPFQHFSIAVLRAVENRRSIVRAANTGISGFIDPVGRMVAQTALFQDAVVTRKVPVVTDITVYSRHPDLFGLTALVAFLAAFVVKASKKTLRRS